MIINWLRVSIYPNPNHHYLSEDNNRYVLDFKDPSIDNEYADSFHSAIDKMVKHIKTYYDRQEEEVELYLKEKYAD